MNVDLLLTGILQGLILALASYGVMIPFRILNCADLSGEGAYPLAGAISSSLLIIGSGSLVAIFIGVIGAGFMGIITSLVHLRLRVNSLLSGIIISTMMYSVNLRLLGKPNVALFNNALLFQSSSLISKIGIMALVLFSMILPLIYFLKTECGLEMRAVGLNPAFAKRQGISIVKYSILGFFLGGCFTGLSGALMVQLQEYMDIGMGIGIVIHALAALMLGEVLLGNETMSKQLTAPLVGALVYQQIQGLAFSIGLAPSDLKFFTGFLVLLIIAMQGLRGKQVGRVGYAILPTQQETKFNA